MSSVLNNLWRSIEWRLKRLYAQIEHGSSFVWQALRWRLRRVTWAIYTWSVCRLAFLYRPLLRRTIFVGVTGSAGKSTTKDLIAMILAAQYSRGQSGLGTMNSPEYVARLVLRTRPSDAFCVTEIALQNDDAGIDLPVAIFEPTVGVVTTIGDDHVSAYGSLDGVAAKKGKLITALSASGIAVLNADDPRVLAMQPQCAGRTITYGLSDVAMLQGVGVSSSWPDRLSFTVKWNGNSVRVQTQLCGTHWVPVVLAAIATGVALGVPLEVAAAAVGRVAPFEARMSPVELSDGVTFIRDDWKAPYWSIGTTFDFMRQASASRKIIVMGTISDYSGPLTTRYVKIARQALEVADCVIFTGPRASACLRARKDASDQLFAFPLLRNASSFLSTYLQPGDLVMLKGSVRTDHLERLILMRTDNVACWRTACRRMYFCNECSLVQVPADPESTLAITRPSPEGPALVTPSTSDSSPLIVIGLGNPGERCAGTPHNVGQCAVDILAQRMGGNWTRESDSAMVVRAQWQGRLVTLIKLLTSINDAGPTLAPLAQELSFAMKDCILIHDDLDLPVGTVRLRQRGGDGGHRGVQSVIQAFQDDQFRRIKIGVGKPSPGQSVAEFVLTPFPEEQRAAVNAANHAAADQVIELIRRELLVIAKASASKDLTH